jgi:hypothetical protein
MAGLDKEETVSIVGALRDVFLRFGSTRLLALAMDLGFFYGMARVDSENAVIYATGAAVVAGVVLVSLHTKPHIDRMKGAE